MRKKNLKTINDILNYININNLDEFMEDFSGHLKIYATAVDRMRRLLDMKEIQHDAMKNTDIYVSAGFQLIDKNN